MRTKYIRMITWFVLSFICCFSQVSVVSAKDTLPSGSYQISHISNTALMMNQNVQLSTVANDSTQKWDIINQDDGTFLIKNQASQQVLTYSKKQVQMEDEDFAKGLNRCPGKTFLLIRESDNRIIGSVNLRWNLDEETLKFGGNIGYGIRPTERRKGYGKLNLYMTLKEAKKIGLDKVMVDCSVDNIGSDRIIKALGGILERCEFDPEDNTMTNVYWINVDESLDKNKDIYEQYISSLSLN